MAVSFAEALSRLEDRRVKATRPLIPPQILQEDLPLYVASIASFSRLLTRVQDPERCTDGPRCS